MEKNESKPLKFMKFLETNRIFYVDEVRKWLKQYDAEEISLSKLVELFHEKFFNWYNNQSTELRKENEELKSEYDEINNLYKAQKAEAHKWRDFVTDKEKELEQQVAELQEQISTYKGRVDRLHQSLEESEKQFEEIQEAYTKLLNE